jgi:hypothetical protein
MAALDGSLRRNVHDSDADWLRVADERTAF